MAEFTLDAGHGGYDPGAVGPTGVQEKDVTLALTLKVGNILKGQGVSVNYTRTSDVFVELDDRAAICNNNGDSNFLSIHINSASAAATGTETYCYATGGNGEKIAAAVLNRLVETLGLPNRGVKTANFAVLRETNPPAALAEVCFISNPSEENILKSDANLDRIALAIARGILDYLGRSYQGSTSAPATTPKPNVMYRVILDGTQVMALSDQGNAEAEVKKAVDSGQAKTGKVQRNTDGQDLFTYSAQEPKPADPQPQEPQQVGTTPILRAATATMQQAQAWAKANGATDTFITLAPIYWNNAAARGGVDPVVAYCQAAKETGFGKFGGVIDESYCNPCGLKITAGGDNNDPAAHNKFNSWDDGIKAHLDHLALYAGAAGYPRKDTTDPRHFDYIAGKTHTVEGLSGCWAPSATYGQEIVALMATLQATPQPQEPTADATKVAQLQKDLDTANNRAVVAEREVENLKGQLAKQDNLKKLLKDFIGGV